MLFLSVMLWSSGRGHTVEPESVRSSLELAHPSAFLPGQNVLPMYTFLFVKEQSGHRKNFV